MDLLEHLVGGQSIILRTSLGRGNYSTETEKKKMVRVDFINFVDLRVGENSK